MHLKVVNVPSILNPIQPSPGFAKKGLADDKLDAMALCAFGCRYCSSNHGNYLRIHRKEFADLTEKQLGVRVLPAEDPTLTFAWPDVLERLDAQTRALPPSYGAGKVLVVSQLTDAFSPLTVANGTTEAALRMVLDRTSYRIRVLTKGAVVGSDKWIEFFRRYPGRFVVGLSIGTLDDAWARAIEVGTSSPTARVRALHRLQDAGIPTFGMLCPILPDAARRDALARLVDAIRPTRCETVWAEPVNDRNNWTVVRAGYAPGSRGWKWMTEAYEERRPGVWSAYATKLFVRLRDRARREGWLSKLHYLLYEGGIEAADASAFAGFEGVLLQGKGAPSPEGKPTGWSTNDAIRRLQRVENDGRLVRSPRAPAAATSRRRS